MPGARVVVAACAALGLLAVAIGPGYALDTAALRLGRVAGSGWALDDVMLHADWPQSGQSGMALTAARAELPQPLGTLRAVTLSCPDLRFDTGGIRCAAGTLVGDSSQLGHQQLATSFRYQQDTGRLELELRGIRYLEGRLSLTAAYDDGDWSIVLDGRQLSLQQASRLAATLDAAVPVLEGDGRLTLTASMRGRGSALAQATIEARVQGAAISNAAGSIAGEDVDLSVTLQASTITAGWRVLARARAERGGFYAEPVYVAIAGQPVTVSARLDWLTRHKELVLRELEYQHPACVRLNAHGRIGFAAAPTISALRIDVREAALGPLYSSYLQPWLSGTPAGRLTAAGALSGQLELRDNAAVAASVRLQDVDLDDQDARFGFTGLAGNLDWSAGRNPEYSELSWTGGHVYRIALGPARIETESSGNTVHLVRSTQIPVLDGLLQLDSFDLAAETGQPLRWQVDGLLTPISMQQLTAALGWPEFGGKLSGVIPAVRYDGGSLVVGGVLLVRVFDGVVTLRDLRLDSPLGLVPRLQVDAHIDNIDLEQLTRTFAFGRIEGRLDGSIEGLRMESWRPVAFDADFATPEDDRSRHRISQKAVDTISNIGGGGVGGALSRSFLRFLEDFPYDRLGIRCRLENGICQMGGVEPAEQGYYLVKGRFIPPRLDVIGYADRVDWDGLVAQIIAVTGQQNVVVQ
ncbi:MAG: hypothetical protein R3F42_06475 [Pseudomonadota bacterium]